MDLVVLENKICSKCKLTKSLSCFGKRSASKDGLKYQCKKCRAEYRAKTDYKKEYAKYSDKIKAYQKNRKKTFSPTERTIFNKKKSLQKYKLSLKDYELLLKVQEFKCAICGHNHNEFDNLAVDHCHKTEEVRGLICRKCNSGIGFLNDDIKLLEKALEYLHEAAEKTKKILRRSI